MECETMKCPKSFQFGPTPLVNGKGSFPKEESWVSWIRRIPAFKWTGIPGCFPYEKIIKGIWILFRFSSCPYFPSWRLYRNTPVLLVSIGTELILFPETYTIKKPSKCPTFVLCFIPSRSSHDNLFLKSKWSRTFQLNPNNLLFAIFLFKPQAIFRFR